MATLLYADGRREKVEPKNGTDFSLEELQGFVGGCVEIVRAPKEQILIVDDEGVLKEKELNCQASRIVKTFIAGDALLCESCQVR